MKKTYSEKLQHPLWQKKRLMIFKRDKWTCRYCSSTEKQLQVHHLKYTKNSPHLEPNYNLITVCKDCHKIVEKLKDPKYNNCKKLICIKERQNHFLCLFKEYAVFLHKEDLSHGLGFSIITVQELFDYFLQQKQNG